MGVGRGAGATIGAHAWLSHGCIQSHLLMEAMLEQRTKGS